MLTKRLEETIGLLLVEAARLLRLQIDRALDGAGLGLTSGEARTLAYVARSPASRQTALAAQINVEPMTLVTFLDKLESRGLVALGKRFSEIPASLLPPSVVVERPNANSSVVKWTDRGRVDCHAIRTCTMVHPTSNDRLAFCARHGNFVVLPISARAWLRSPAGSRPAIVWHRTDQRRSRMPPRKDPRGTPPAAGWPHTRPAGAVLRSPAVLKGVGNPDAGPALRSQVLDSSADRLDETTASRRTQGRAHCRRYGMRPGSSPALQIRFRMPDSITLRAPGLECTLPSIRRTGMNCRPLCHQDLPGSPFTGFRGDLRYSTAAGEKPDADRGLPAFRVAAFL